MDADFSLWQDSENAWSMRLKAQPMRTNSNLSDTGILRAEGSWQRSATLGETPVNFNLQWENAQLGQFTKLATGTDRGWRGTVVLTAAISGTPADLSVTTNASIQDFRRYDIVGGDPLFDLKPVWMARSPPAWRPQHRQRISVGGAEQSAPRGGVVLPACVDADA